DLSEVAGSDKVANDEEAADKAADYQSLGFAKTILFERKDGAVHDLDEGGFVAQGDPGKFLVFDQLSQNGLIGLYIHLTAGGTHGKDAAGWVGVWIGVHRAGYSGKCIVEFSADGVHLVFKDAEIVLGFFGAGGNVKLVDLLDEG